MIEWMNATRISRFIVFCNFLHQTNSLAAEVTYLQRTVHSLEVCCQLQMSEQRYSSLVLAEEELVVGTSRIIMFSNSLHQVISCALIHNWSITNFQYCVRKKNNNIILVVLPVCQPRCSRSTHGVVGQLTLVLSLQLCGILHLSRHHQVAGCSARDQWLWPGGGGWGVGGERRRGDRGKGETVLRDKSLLPHYYIVRRKTTPVILVYDTYQTIFAHNIIWGSPTCQINHLMCWLLVGRRSSEESVVGGEERMHCMALWRVYIGNARGYRCAGSWVVFPENVKAHTLPILLSSLDNT